MYYLPLVPYLVFLCNVFPCPFSNKLLVGLKFRFCSYMQSINDSMSKNINCLHPGLIAGPVPNITFAPLSISPTPTCYSTTIRGRLRHVYRKWLQFRVRQYFALGDPSILTTVMTFAGLILRGDMSVNLAFYLTTTQVMHQGISNKIIASML